MPKPMVIDLSHHNTVNDLEMVESQGIEGIIHKATEGTGFIDSKYDNRMDWAEQVGMLWGAYHFLRPGKLKEQAEFFVDVAGECDLYAADHEDSNVSLDDLKVFLEEVEKLTGKLPVIYSGHVLKEQVGDKPDPELGIYRLWLAQYAKEPEWPKQIWKSYWLWQYTDQGHLNGIEGNVDLNQYDGTAEELRADWLGVEVRPEPEIAEVTITITGHGKVKVKIIDET